MRAHRHLVRCAAIPALAALSSCGSSGESSTGLQSKLERSVTAAQAQVRGTAVKRSAKCDSTGDRAWECSLQVITASPEGAADPVVVEYRVMLDQRKCWTARFASGDHAPLRGTCLR